MCFKWPLPFHVSYVASLPWNTCWLTPVCIGTSWEIGSSCASPSGSHLGMCRPDGWAGSHRLDINLDDPWCFFSDPTWTSWPVPSLLPHILVVLDGFSAFAFIYPKTVPWSSVSIGLSAQEVGFLKSFLSSLPDAFLKTSLCMRYLKNIASCLVWLLEVFSV